MSKLSEILIENPIIAAIRNEKDLPEVAMSSSQLVFILHGSIMNIKPICDSLKASGKLVFIHIDMIEGLRNDMAGLEFIKKHADPYGIITTKPTNVKQAKQLGLSTIQRIFIIDSLSLETGIKNIKDVLPDAVEVMPGIASKIFGVIEKEVPVPIIAGGLINDKKDVFEALGSGAVAISTSKRELWDL